MMAQVQVYQYRGHSVNRLWAVIIEVFNAGLSSSKVQSEEI